MAFPDAWAEEALVTIQPVGANNIEYAAAFLTADLDQGDKPIDIIPNLAGGRIVKINPEEPTMITLEGHFVELDPTSFNGIHQLFHTISGNYDTSEPLAVVNSRNRDRFRVAILWTNDASATSAAGATAASTDAFRFYADNARFVSAKDTFTDGILKTTAKFQVPPFTKTGTGNINWNSGDDTALAALTSFS